MSKKYIFWSVLVSSLFFNAQMSYATLGGDGVAISSPIAANDGNCRGTVVDSKGMPIIGVQVLVKGTAKGASTDLDGHFTISGVNNGVTLVVKFVGYKSQEVVWNGQPLNIVLAEDTKQLEEVVVVGYGTQKKRDLTGAVSSIKMDETQKETFTTISHALAGKAAGLQVNISSAQVGGGASFKIRGAGSISAGNSPLIIIDGFPVGGGTSVGSGNIFNAGSTDNILSSLNPNDIASIEVLKDASSTAIYGSRAGHGVIIITTKRGRENSDVQVHYTGSVSVSKLKNGYKVLSGPEYMRQVNRYSYESFLQTHGMDVYKDYVPVDPAKASDVYSPSYTDEEIKNAPTTNWFDEVTTLGVKHNHDISIMGGSKTTKYMASLSITEQSGVVKNNDMKRFTGKINLDQSIGKYFNVGLSINFSRNQFNNVPLGDGEFENAGILSSSAMALPYMTVYDENGDFSVNPKFSQLPNPVSLLTITDKSTKNRFLGSFFVEMTPIKGLRLKANLGTDLQMEKRENYVPKTTNYGSLNKGVANIGEGLRNDYVADFTATYTHDFDNHSLTALLGYSYQQFNTSGFNAGNSDFIIDEFKYNNLGAGNFAKPRVGSYAGKNSLGSYFARVNYSYLDRYLLTATMRADGAANFDPKHRWGYFPSVSIGWRFSEEPFMEKAKAILSNGKLRIGYGQTGNSNVGDRTLSLYNTGYNGVFGLTNKKAYTGMLARQLGNPFITWETTSELNVGLDFGLFKNRISGSIEYYNRVISDLLVTNKSLPSYNEITSIASNIGATMSQGMEFTLNTVNISTQKFEWRTDFTLSFYHDRWKERDPNWKPAVYQKANDYIRSAYSKISEGLLRPGEERPAAQPTLLPGQVKIKDINKDGHIDDNDVVLLGSWDPAFIFGLNNTFNMWRFDLNIFLYGQVNQLRGQSYYEQWAMQGYGTVQGRNSSKGIYDTWTHDNLSAKYPNILGAGPDGSGDYFLKKISFIRCRNITLGYSIPVKKYGTSMRVYADVNNPFVITNWTGVDPETDNGKYSYPNSTTFSLGLDLTF